MSFGQTLNKVFFWSYERGSWQYDIAVLLILAFVFTPKSWFNDQPQVGLPANAQQVERLKDNGESQVYKVDARVLAPPEKTPALQNDLHTALQKAVPELQDGRFSIGRIEPQRDEHGNVTAYEVEIKH